MQVSGINTNAQTALAKAQFAHQEANMQDFAKTLTAEQEKLQTENSTVTENQTKELVKLKKTCQDMESVFLGLMLKNMRNTVMRSSLIPESNGEKIMRSMLDQELATKMSKAGGIGIASMLYKELSNNYSQQKKLPPIGASAEQAVKLNSAKPVELKQTAEPVALSKK